MWSKTDTKLLEVVLTAGIILVAAFGGAAPLFDASGVGLGPLGVDRPVMNVSGVLQDPVPVPGAPTLPADPIAAGDPRQVEMSGADRVDVTFWAPTAGQRLQYLAGPSLVSLTGLVVLALLLLVARSLRSGEPFTVANARRVTAIGAALAVGGTFAPLVTDMTHLALLSATEAGPLVRTNEFTISFLWLVVGLVVASLGEVFRRGVALRVDVDGLV
ncbi:MAG: DUF2975 domain-containing protein [Sporichthyaceae bacterium]